MGDCAAVVLSSKNYPFSSEVIDFTFLKLMPNDILDPGADVIELKVRSRRLVMLADDRILFVFVLVMVPFEVV